MINVCVLRSGGEYKPEHVEWLAQQVPHLYCLTDQWQEVMELGIRPIPLRYTWPGWFSKLELFRPEIDEDLMYFDLDTVIVRMPKTPDRTTVLRDFTDRSIMGSGLMFIKHEDKTAVWNDWMRDPEWHMKRNSKWPHWGDQGFLQAHLGNAQKWQDVAKVYSYKVHCRDGLPNDAEAVCFHGKPRPWSVNANWIPTL